MKWTPEKVEELRCLAPQGGRAVAAHFGISYMAVCKAGSDRGISLGGSHMRQKASLPKDIRARWATLLPAMKAALRADVERIMAE